MGKTSLDLNEVRDDRDGSGISWTICKQSAPRSRQITTPTPLQSIFTGQMLFVMPNQQCQSTEGSIRNLDKFRKYLDIYFLCTDRWFVLSMCFVKRGSSDSNLPHINIGFQPRHAMVCTETVLVLTLFFINDNFQHLM